jgi:hypothetical protein
VPKVPKVPGEGSEGRRPEEKRSSEEGKLGGSHEFPSGDKDGLSAVNRAEERRSSEEGKEGSSGKSPLGGKDEFFVVNRGSSGEDGGSSGWRVFSPPWHV